MNYPKNVFLAGLYAGITALAINLALYFLGASLGIMRDDLIVQPPQQQITAVPVIFITVMATVIATLLYAALRRFFKSHWRIFLVISAIVFALEIIPPLMLPAPLGMKLWLELLHVTTAAPILYLFWKLPKK